jgi:uncharacterized protein with PQ loop repeat
MQDPRITSTRALEGAVYAASLFGPIVTIPQIWLIFATGRTDGVSVVTWVGYVGVALVWAAYGVARGVKPLIFSNLLWAFVEILVIVGLLTH